MRERGEGDGKGDVDELRRLLRGSGLEVASLWLSGDGWRDLCGALAAETLIALPFGFEAARTLAERSGAKHAPLPLPVSLSGTAEWLSSIGRATGRRAEVEAFASRELDRVVPLIDRYTTRFLRGKRVLVAATGDWLPGIVRCFSEDLGMEVTAAVARQRRYSVPVKEEVEEASGFPASYDPSVASLRSHVDRAFEDGGLDLVVGSFWERSALLGIREDVPFLEFGFPQRRAHFLAPTPHLGFQGVVTWAQRTFEALELSTC